MWPSFRDCQPEKRNSISHSDDIEWICENAKRKLNISSSRLSKLDDDSALLLEALYQNRLSSRQNNNSMSLVFFLKILIQMTIVVDFDDRKLIFFFKIDRERAVPYQGKVSRVSSRHVFTKASRLIFH